MPSKLSLRVSTTFCVWKLLRRSTSHSHLSKPEVFLQGLLAHISSTDIYRDSVGIESGVTVLDGLGTSLLIEFATFARASALLVKLGLQSPCASSAACVSALCSSFLWPTRRCTSHATKNSPSEKSRSLQALFRLLRVPIIADKLITARRKAPSTTLCKFQRCPCNSGSCGPFLKTC